MMSVGGGRLADMTDALATFSAPTGKWFRSVFEAPTAVQVEAWSAIANGEHALVVAPTGSGKTLAAFLWALDTLASRPANPGTKVVYVSPLKALGVDIERNLRAPLTGIRVAAERLQVPLTDITVGVRSGDTPPQARAALVRTPPSILITTPESLYLMLTSSARSTLTGVETVIVDEIHAVAGTKRGSHLALSLERLDALVGHDVQRVALSATVRPVERVARFLGGDRPVRIVAPPAHKQWDVSVRLPVTDITQPGPAPGAEPPVDPLLGGPGTDTLAVDAATSPSLWPHIEAEVYQTVTSGRSTLVFTNSRRTAERLTGRLNELWAAEHAPDTLDQLPDRPPAQVMAPSDIVRGVPAVIARAHHGSVSKEARADIEAALKSGDLRCVVATSSLELGIDMGAVDRVVQVGAPASVASALQRIGRSGHDVGATSRGEVYPLHRGDLGPSVVATESMLAGRIEELRVPRHPLDVLAQQTVAAAAAAGDAGLDVDTWYATVTRSHPYARLDRALLDSIIELVTGAYPAADFGELRARLAQGDDGRLYPRPGALRLAVTSGGTIPDRGMFGVFLVADEQGPAGWANWMRRWSTNPGSVTCSPWVRPPGRSRRSPVTRYGCRPLPAAPAGCRSGAATTRAGPPNSDARSAGSTGRSRRSRPGSTGCTWTPTPGPTWPPTSPSSGPPPARYRTTGPWSSNASATSSATGGWSSTPPWAGGCWALGRW